MIRLQRGEVARAVLLLLLTGLAVNQVRIALEGWGRFILIHPGFADFGNYYLYARVGLHQGWAHLYDLAAQRREWMSIGGPTTIPWFPIIYPPPLAWVVVPLTILPLPAAFITWFSVLLGSMLFAWKLMAQGWSTLTRWSSLAAMVAVFAVPFALILGQILILELAAIAGAWWLLGRGREVAAGLLLTTLVFKPQVAILVPLVLLVTNRKRAVMVWAMACAGIGAIAVASTGVDGIHAYAVRVLAAAANRPEFLVPQQLTLGGLIGRGPLLLSLDGLLLVLVIIGAYRHRQLGLDVPFACGLVGSMMLSPYLHYEDLATLLLAGGMACHGLLDRPRRGLLLAGFVLLLGISYVGSGGGAIIGALLLTCEAVWLASLAVFPLSGGASRELVPLRQVPLDRTA